MAIKYIVGLGNPGEEYEDTFHNVGNLFLDTLSEGKTFSSKTGKHFEFLHQDPYTLIRPMAFMNESGGAVKEALSFFKAKPEEFLLVHDDSDIPLGEFKLCFDRGAAGHKGVLSVIETLKTQKFWRLRIGIRAKVGIKASDMVLKKIGKHERETLYSTFEGAKMKVSENE